MILIIRLIQIFNWIICNIVKPHSHFNATALTYLNITFRLPNFVHSRVQWGQTLTKFFYRWIPFAAQAPTKKKAWIKSKLPKVAAFHHLQDKHTQTHTHSHTQKELCWTPLLAPKLTKFCTFLRARKTEKEFAPETD